MISEIPHLSVVSPVYQSEELIDELVSRLVKSLQTITDDFEIILVEDGGKDKSWEKIRAICQVDSRIKGIKLSRNFGQHFAISAGLHATTGVWIVVMDCDLQDRPEEIPSLYQKALEGYEIVQARRVERHDPWQKRLFSYLFYRVLSFLSGTQYDNTIANFGIYYRDVIDSVLSMQETIRYFPAMINWVGYSKTSLAVGHSQRPRGKSAYNFKRQCKLAVDILLAYSDKPLRLIIGLGALISLIAFLFAAGILIQFLRREINVLGYASLMTSICFFSGVIVSVLGIVGLYVGKIFEGIKRRPSYLIQKKSNFVSSEISSNRF